MAFIYDHDMHIHSRLSPCSGDENQTCSRILEYALENGLNTVAVTDHFWDSAVPGASDWYRPLNYDKLSQNKPVPSNEKVRFLFGCETDMDMNGNIGLKKENFGLFDFVIVSTTHLHNVGFTVPAGVTRQGRRDAYVRRFYYLLDADIPFGKVGIAHPTCNLIDHSTRDAHIEIIDSVSDNEFYNIFSGVAEKGLGVELNIYVHWYSDDELKRILRPYHIAKECGCKFYLGSDSHHNADLMRAPQKLQRIINVFPLEETDKFIIK